MQSDASDNEDDEYELPERVDAGEVAELLSDARRQERRSRNEKEPKKRASRTTVSAGKKRHKFKFNDQCRMYLGLLYSYKEDVYYIIVILVRDMKAVDKKKYKQSVHEAYLNFLKANDKDVSTVISGWKCSPDEWRSSTDKKR